MTDTRLDILDTAEQRMRDVGYHSVSFRDLADDLGIKSASVHYHFRRKEHLGVELVRRYANRFFDILEVLVESGMSPIEAFAQAYRRAFLKNHSGCLCGMLASEARGLPQEVSDEVTKFMDHSIDWVVNALPSDMDDATRRQAAVQVLASLQGAMMLAVSQNDPWMLDAIVEGLIPE